MSSRRLLGWGILMLGVVTTWLSFCLVSALWLQEHVIKPPPALGGERLAALEAVGKAYQQHPGAVPPAAIIALGGGRESYMPEYGDAGLTHYSSARLHYAVWLSRRTGLPVGFAGGVGWGQRMDPGPSEADIAQRQAQSFYGTSLRWVENQSADTRQNAVFTVAKLAAQQVPEIVLVTDAFHMPRALRLFRRAAEQYAAKHPGAVAIRVTPAPIGFWQGEGTALSWLPSGSGAIKTTLALHECLGLIAQP